MVVDHGARAESPGGPALLAGRRGRFSPNHEPRTGVVEHEEDDYEPNGTLALLLTLIEDILSWEDEAHPSVSALIAAVEQRCEVRPPARPKKPGPPKGDLSSTPRAQKPRTPSAPRLDDATFLRLYVDERLTLHAIAAHAHVSNSTVVAIKRRLGVKRPPKPEGARDLKPRDLKPPTRHPTCVPPGTDYRSCPSLREWVDRGYRTPPAFLDSEPEDDGDELIGFSVVDIDLDLDVDIGTWRPRRWRPWPPR